MHTSDDMRLLEEYASGHSEEAFTALVSRHINLVHSAAMRSVNNPHEAQEITQAVFVTLARKSRALRRGTVLSGWLYQTARLTACNFIRTETRRQQREQEAHIQSTMNDPDPETWTRVGPLLEEAMAQLNEQDRNAIVLRFFEGKALKEVGEALGASEDAAKMRVSRALEKLRAFFQQRGVLVPSGVLAAAIAANSITAAPAGLAASVAGVAAGAAKGSALTVSTLALMKGTIQMMTSAKIGLAVGVGAAAIVAFQAREIHNQKQTVADLEAQVSQEAQSNQMQQAQIASLQERVASYVKSMDTMSRDTAKSRANANAALDAQKLAAEAMKAAATAKKAAAGAKGNSFAEMFKDPEMLKAMRPMQLVTMRTMYGPLVKQLNLSPEQADKFYDILVDNGLKSLQGMQSGKSLVDTSADIKQTLQADLQSLLGEAGFAQYTDYTKNEMQGQMMLASMRNNFVDNPLSDAQEQQLLQAMKTARQNVNADNPLANASDKTANMDQVLQQQEQINQSVLQQAAAFLSPAQLQTLGTSQSNMVSMQKGMAPMMQKMMGTPTASP